MIQAWLPGSVRVRRGRVSPGWCRNPQVLSGGSAVEARTVEAARAAARAVRGRSEAGEGVFMATNSDGNL
jgi:hypothetical protein